jgi:hypothetical protein
MPPSKVARVFISYSTRDKKKAKILCSLLEQNGLPCWIAPRDIRPGIGWAEGIVLAIKESCLLLVLLSEHASKSPNMARELNRAATCKIPLLPVRLDNAPLVGAFAYFLEDRQWVEIAGRRAGEYASELVNAVRTLCAPGNDSPSSAAGAQEPARPSGGVSANEVPTLIKMSILGLFSPGKALSEVNLASSASFGFSLGILTLLSLASVVFHIPAWSAMGISFGHPAFLGLAAADALIEELAFCCLLYAAIRLSGGVANPQDFFCAYFLLGAFLLMSNLCLVPIYAPTIDIQKHACDFQSFITAATALDISAANAAVIILGYLAYCVLRLALARALFQAFHITEQLGAARSMLAFVAGMILWTVSAMVVSQPLEAYLYKGQLLPCS